jgi:sporulation integral membrane protein YlbJ
MSILSGYPVGSKIIAELYQNNVINSNESTKMSTFCSTSGPLFIIGSVGIGMLSNKTIGFTLYLCHIISGILCGMIFRFYGGISKDILPVKKPAIDNILGEAIYTSVISILTVGGFITIFYILADMLIDFNILLPLQCFISLLLAPFTKDTTLAKYITEGLIEGTRGCGLLASLSNPLVLPAISFVIAFGGLSIIIQQLTYLKKAKANLGVFMLSKFLHATLSFILCFIFI